MSLRGHRDSVTQPSVWWEAKGLAGLSQADSSQDWYTWTEAMIWRIWSTDVMKIG